MTGAAHGWTAKRTYARDYTTPPFRRVKVLPIESWDGPRIYRLRQRLGVSQTVMAAMLGVNRVSLTRWENGAARIEKASVLRLLSLLDKAPELFFLEPR